MAAFPWLATTFPFHMKRPQPGGCDWGQRFKGADRLRRRAYPTQSVAIGSHCSLLKQRPDIGAAATASLAGEPGLEIRQANVIVRLAWLSVSPLKKFGIAGNVVRPKLIHYSTYLLRTEAG